MVVVRQCAPPAADAELSRSVAALALVVYRDLRRDRRTDFDFGWLAATRFIIGRTFLGGALFFATLMTSAAISGLGSAETTFQADFDAF